MFFSRQPLDMSNKETRTDLANETMTVEPNPKVIVTYKGSTYNISDFVRKHPGGKKVLLENNGKDVEKLMLENEHSEHAYQLLEKYKIN